MIGIAWLKTQTQKLKTMHSMKKDLAQDHLCMVPPASDWMAVRIVMSGERARAPDQANLEKDNGTGAEMKREEAASGAPRARKKDQDWVNNQANLLFS